MRKKSGISDIFRGLPHTEFFSVLDRVSLKRGPKGLGVWGAAKVRMLLGIKLVHILRSVEMTQ